MTWWPQKGSNNQKQDCKNDIYEAGLPLLPEPLITRWAIWLRTALYNSENLLAVCTIDNNWTKRKYLSQLSKKA